MDYGEPPSKKIRILQNVVLRVREPCELAMHIPELSPSPAGSQFSPGSTQTDLNLSSRTPRKEKLRLSAKKLRNDNEQLAKKNRKLQQELDETSNNAIDKISIEQYMSLTYKFCPSRELADFINTQICEIHKHPKGRRYSLEFKSECLAMYFSGPKLYKKNLMHKFCLPTPPTLLKLVKNLKVRPGFNNPELFNMLRMKSEAFSEEDRICLLCVDEMSIKADLFYATGLDTIVGLEDDGSGTKAFKPALTATVFMIRGIKTKWSQPICYNFFQSTCPGNKLKSIITDIIHKLKEINLNVCVLVSDMGSNNIQLKRLLQVTPNQPYFFVNEQKVIYMFDTPHLVKTVRNNLRKHNFLKEDMQEISWKYVEDFYNHDKKYVPRAAPRLTDSHIFPNNFEKMKVKFASQVFSQTVSAGLNLYIRFGALPASAVSTAEFIEMMDKLFDILNSSTLANVKQFRRAFKAEEYQVDFLKDCLNFFTQIKIIDKSGNDVTTRIKFLDCFKITINGLLHLWESWLTQKFTFVLTRRLNQDGLENFFGTIRQQNGNCINPTAIQFQRTFKKLLCVKLFHSGTENCEGDADKMLLRLRDIQNHTSVEETAPLQFPEPTNNEPIIDGDYQKNDILLKNFQTYLCGYLIRKCLQVHTCPICNSYAHQVEEMSDTTLFCYFKAYETGNHSNFGNLMMPNDGFVTYVSKLEVLFQREFENICTKETIIWHLINLGREIKYEHPCEKFPATYLLKLYVRLRLFYTLKLINRNFKSVNKNKVIIWKHQ